MASLLERVKRAWRGPAPAAERATWECPSCGQPMDILEPDDVLRCRRCDPYTLTRRSFLIGAGAAVALAVAAPAMPAAPVAEYLWVPSHMMGLTGIVDDFKCVSVFDAIPIFPALVKRNAIYMARLDEEHVLAKLAGVTP